MLDDETPQVIDMTKQKTGSNQKGPSKSGPATEVVNVSASNIHNEHVVYSHSQYNLVS